MRLTSGRATGCLDPVEQSASVGGQVGLTVCRGQQEPARFGSVDPVLKLAWLAGEPAQITADQRIELPGGEVSNHAVIGRAVRGSLGRRDGAVRPLTRAST